MATRLELADGLNACDPRDIAGRARPEAQAILDAAAAELRKRCDGCKHFRVDKGAEEGHCDGLSANEGGSVLVPFDGSGFCFAHESAKPTDEAGA